MPDCHRKQNLPLKPLIKWAGGKSRLIAQFLFLFPVKVNFLVEPFFGGGAVFLHLNPTGAIISDKNEELMNFYRVVRDHPVELLADLKDVNTEEYYYRVRSLTGANDLWKEPRVFVPEQVRYNGLWRLTVRASTTCPTAVTRIKSSSTNRTLSWSAPGLRKPGSCAVISRWRLKKLNRGCSYIWIHPTIRCRKQPVSPAIHLIPSGKRSNAGWPGLFRTSIKGVQGDVSNSDTPFIRELYRGYNIVEVKARRAINCKGEGRGLLTELVIRNYH